MSRIQKMVVVGLAAAGSFVPSLARAERYGGDDQAIEQLASDIQHDRFELQRAEQARDWNKVRFERNQIHAREGRLHDMIRRVCR
ncbi:MAG TPA: hypothetical protein VGH28_03750 [Polyangiaceae bacterium]